MSKSADAVIRDYQQDTRAIYNGNLMLVEKLIQEVDPIRAAVQDFFDEEINELKGYLGAAAANGCGDCGTEQNEAIATCETWVTNNVSNADTVEWILAVMNLNGINEGATLIRVAIADARKTERTTDGVA